MSGNIYNIKGESSDVCLPPPLSTPSAPLPSCFPAKLNFLNFISQARSVPFFSPSLLHLVFLFFLTLSISPLTNKQVSREPVSSTVQRGHRPVWPLWRPEPHRDWLGLGNCSERSREWQTGIACLRQKHGASCQLLSLRGEDWVPGWLLDKTVWRVSLQHKVHLFSKYVVTICEQRIISFKILFIVHCTKILNSKMRNVIF